MGEGVVYLESDLSAVLANVNDGSTSFSVLEGILGPETTHDLDTITRHDIGTKEV